MGKQIVSREDSEIAAELQKALEAEGLQFALNARTTRAENKNGSVVLSYQGPAGSSTVTGSHLLIPAGRVHNTYDLVFAYAGISTNKAGSIKVYGRLETTVHCVWALRACKSRPPLTQIS